MKYIIALIFCFLSLLSDAKTSCHSAQYRQFDFWIGQWHVTTTNDDVIRQNSITSINQGCALLEEYKTPSGYTGKSLNIYDKSSKRWYQTWVDSSGVMLQLTGGMQGNSMVMEGITMGKTGKILNKISWTPLTDGKVRQHWQTSSDNGQHWQTVFDGLYVKAP